MHAELSSATVPVPLPFVEGLFSDARISRVLLRWDLLSACGVTANLHHGAAVDPAWFTPWHVDERGLSCDFDAPGARPLRLGEAATDLLLQGHSMHRDRLEQLSASFARTRQKGGVLQLPVLSWAVPRGVLVLDGNHRLLAALLTGVPVSVLEFRLAGPCDPLLLPDLVHH